MERDLRCPSCGGLVVVAQVERVLSAQSARCPYPTCAAPIITVMTWSDAAPTVFYTHAEVVGVFRAKLVRDVIAFFFAQTILATAVYAAGYAIHHVTEAPPPKSFVQTLAHAGIWIGAGALTLPTVLIMLVLAVGLCDRVRRDRQILRRLAAAPSCDGFRLAPCPRSYRGL